VLQYYGYKIYNTCEEKNRDEKEEDEGYTNKNYGEKMYRYRQNKFMGLPGSGHAVGEDYIIIQYNII